MTVGAADDRHEQETETTAQRVTAALQARDRPSPLPFLALAPIKWDAVVE